MPPHTHTHTHTVSPSLCVSLRLVDECSCFFCEESWYKFSSSRLVPIFVSLPPLSSLSLPLSLSSSLSLSMFGAQLILLYGFLTLLILVVWTGALTSPYLCLLLCLPLCLSLFPVGRGVIVCWPWAAVVWAVILVMTSIHFLPPLLLSPPSPSPSPSFPSVPSTPFSSLFPSFLDSNSFPLLSSFLFFLLPSLFSTSITFYMWSSAFTRLMDRDGRGESDGQEDFSGSDNALAVVSHELRNLTTIICGELCSVNEIFEDSCWNVLSKSSFDSRNSLCWTLTLPGFPLIGLTDIKLEGIPEGSMSDEGRHLVAMRRSAIHLKTTLDAVLEYARSLHTTVRSSCVPIPSQDVKKIISSFLFF
jgi:hypothetical protein